MNTPCLAPGFYILCFGRQARTQGGNNRFGARCARKRRVDRRRDGAKLLHKALDRRHRLSINRFDKAETTEEVRASWKEAVQRGEIPGAYWAALTHPATNDVLLREIFAEVHMLSHLVGDANRADIRRLASRTARIGPDRGSQVSRQ
jgi:hypothetical protein